MLICGDGNIADSCVKLSIKVTFVSVVGDMIYLGGILLKIVPNWISIPRCLKFVKGQSSFVYLSILDKTGDFK